MAVRFATVGDVKRILPEFGSDFGASSKYDAIIEDSLDEASDRCRNFLIARYELSVIEALSPFPPSIVKFTSYYAAKMFLGWQGFKKEDTTGAKLNMLSKIADYWQKQIFNKTILDASGNAVPAKPLESASAPASSGGIDNLYKGGPRGRFSDQKRDSIFYSWD